MIDNNTAPVIATFIDKRGCFYYRTNERGHHFHTFKISTVDASIIRLLYRLTNMGHVKENTNSNGKITYTWLVHSRSELYHLLTNVIPYLKNRRKEAEEMLEFLKYKRRQHRFTPETARAAVSRRYQPSAK
ncbi:MAG TPA: hypothetical protein ENL13_04255 [Thermoplasmatales archaeon]|nr:hypothetical protein [Thermoplasmatales archaeon]